MDPFATLGIARTFDVDLAAVEINEAWRVLRDPIRRAEALLALRGVPIGEGPGGPTADPAFLMDMLEQREALAEARRTKDVEAVRRMAAAIGERARSVERALAQGFARDEVDGLAGKVGELKFYRRFLDEVSAIEDEWAA